jgi:RimJ/RimL family protein N-acetyltransferase
MTELLPGDLFVGKLVRLSAFKADAKDAYARWSQDAEYSRLLTFNAARPRTPESFADVEKEHKDDAWRHFVFAICTLADDKMIGYTELEMTWVHQHAWIAIGMGDPDYRNKGYGTDAFRLTVNYGFRELGLYKISLGVFDYNPRARHVYEKCGFVMEGTQRSLLYRDGQYYDLHLLGITRPKWERLPSTQELAHR